MTEDFDLLSSIKDYKTSIGKTNETTSETTPFNVYYKDSFNKAIDHIINLLTDSYILLKNNSYGSSAFLSITAMEETSKTHLSIFFKYSPEKRKKILLNHHKKQMLSISPVLKIGTRLPKAIGFDRIDELIKWTQDNRLMDIRNNSIYWYTKDKISYFPIDSVSKRLAQDILLFSIETFDDSLIGYNKYSIKASQKTDELFEKIENELA